MDTSFTLRSPQSVPDRSDASERGGMMMREGSRRVERVSQFQVGIQLTHGEVQCRMDEIGCYTFLFLNKLKNKFGDGV